MQLKYPKINLKIEFKMAVAFTMCTIVQQGINLLTIPLFTRLMSQEQYGEVTIYDAWQVLFLLFLTLNLAYGSFSKAMIKFEKDREQYIASVHGITFLLTAVFLVVYFFFHKQINLILEMNGYMVFIMILDTLGKNSILMWSGEKRFKNLYGGVVAVTVLIALFAPGLSLVLVHFFQDKGMARIIGYALPNIVIGSVLTCKYIFHNRSVFDAECWKYALGYNIPLIMYYLSQTIFNQSDRVMISHLIGKDKAAIYGVAYVVGMGATVLINAINNAYTPWLYKKIEENSLSKNKKISALIASGFSLILICIVWLSPEILFLLGGEAYVEAKYIIFPIAGGALLLFYAQIFNDFQFYYERKQSLVVITIYSAILNILLNFFGIPKYGAIVAGYTTLISYLFLTIGTYLAISKEKNIKCQLKEAVNVYTLIGVFVVFCIFCIIGILLYEYVIIRLCCVCVMFFLLLVLVVKQRGMRLS